MATWNLDKTKHHVLICNGSSCNRAGAEEVTQAIRSEIANQELDEYIHTTRTRCNGRFHDKCVVISYPDGIWYKDMKPDDAQELINSLKTDQLFVQKTSHAFCGEGFQRTEGTVKGISKQKEMVIKVSKKL
ncbi:(2Fe-2S) ferredoxin domain-containing protein [Priestia megaterium]|uniref:(2Fe-2S) ferredoxin domain-containing protein n=1 Tax=Priestia megaterium TaxID=1404 RepID=UPI002D80DAAE|nr:(2Fe-2S) ferredoxin domain-containing protein [Priestia megaterium]MEB4856895.1 (2Fe-2S) ferredoxin domain-containing protein [Priestia megaterium]